MDAAEIFHNPRPESTHGKGNCSGCGLPFYTDRTGLGKDRAISTGIDIDYEGTLIFCEWCVRQLGACIGLEEPKERKPVPTGLSPAQQLAMDEFFASVEQVRLALQ